MPYIPTTLDTDVTCEGEWRFLTYADIWKEKGTRNAKEAIDDEKRDPVVNVMLFLVISCCWFNSQTATKINQNLNVGD